MTICFYDYFSYEIILTLWLIVSKGNLFEKEKNSFQGLQVIYWVPVQRWFAFNGLGSYVTG